MNGHFETNGIYPLSTQPAEGYIGDPSTRSGTKILIHAHNGKFVKLDSSNPAHFTLVESRDDATKFEDDSVASLEAARLIQKARDDNEQRQAA